MSRRLVVVTVAIFILQFLLQFPTPSWRVVLDYETPGRRAELLKHADELDAIAYSVSDVQYVSILEKWCPVVPKDVEHGQIWRLFTYAFLHSRSMMLHIIFNMMALWSFGPLMEALWGRREFLAFYFAAAIFAGLCHVILGLVTNTPNGAVGASGAIMGLLMAFAVYYPRHLVSVFMFTLEARVLVAIYILWDSFPVIKMLLGQRDGFGLGVAHAAHLGGLAFGYFYCILGWKLTGWMDRWRPLGSRPSAGQVSSTRSSGLKAWWNKWFKSKPKLKLHSGPEEQSAATPRDLESRVDAVLKKIKELGEENITEADRDVLREAARVYKKRD